MLIFALSVIYLYIHIYVHIYVYIYMYIIPNFTEKRNSKFKTNLIR
jgi:hypothetical protein